MPKKAPTIRPNKLFWLLLALTIPGVALAVYAGSRANWQELNTRYPDDYEHRDLVALRVGMTRDEVQAILGFPLRSYSRASYSANSTPAGRVIVELYSEPKVNLPFYWSVYLLYDEGGTLTYLNLKSEMTESIFDLPGPKPRYHTPYLQLAGLTHEDMAALGSTCVR